jgi:hypothetical protein
MVRQFPRDAPEIRHQFFDGRAGERLGEHLNGIANKLVAITERE